MIVSTPVAFSAADEGGGRPTGVSEVVRSARAPRRAPRGHEGSKVRAELVRLLGAAKARKLMERFGGKKIRIPQPDLFDRNRMVIRALDEPTATLDSVAKRFRLSRRQVARIGKTT